MRIVLAVLLAGIVGAFICHLVYFVKGAMKNAEELDRLRKENHGDLPHA